MEHDGIVEDVSKFASRPGDVAILDFFEDPRSWNIENESPFRFQTTSREISYPAPAFML